MTSIPIERVSEEDLIRMAGIIKCLGHPLRLRLLEALEGGEQSVSDLQKGTGATQAAVSQQLAILRGRDVVAHRRDGPNVYYWIIEPRVSVILDCVRNCAP